MPSLQLLLPAPNNALHEKGKRNHIHTLVYCFPYLPSLKLLYSVSHLQVAGSCIDESEMNATPTSS